MTVVYFIKPIGLEGPIKIGCSISPDGRRCTLQSWSPLPLEIAAEIAGDFELERRFHAAFRESHRSREWFDVTPALVATIEAIAAGTFDVSTLPPPRRLPSYHKARTADQQASVSLSLRISHMERRSGTNCRVYRTDAYRRGEPEALSMAHAYLADPLAHGDWGKYPWAVEAREKFAAARPESVAA